VLLAAAVILEDANLRREAALQDNVEIAVAVNIGNRECSRIIGEVEAADSRNVVKRADPAVGVTRL
jgi:hypothetical protein